MTLADDLDPCTKEKVLPQGILIFYHSKVMENVNFFFSKKYDLDI